MAVILKQDLDQILDMTCRMEAGEIGSFNDEQLSYIKIVHRSTTALQSEQVSRMTLRELSAKSHDLRQLLTSIVGYSALLNSPKLSDHNTLMRQQLIAIHQLHEWARELHWRLDGLILFAVQIVRPRQYTTQDLGMLNLGGYLRAQADHYVCRRFVVAVNIPDGLPNVYANDTFTKLMLRGLFSIALDIIAEPAIEVSAYTIMKFVRARVSVNGGASYYDELMKLLEVTHLEERADRTTKSMHMEITNLNSMTLLQLGLFTAANLAQQQGGRMKLEHDSDRLVFTVTMPTDVPHAVL